MSTENKHTTNHKDLLTKLHEARKLVDECIAGFDGRAPRKPKGESARPAPSHRPTPSKLDFDAHERAFMKTHAKGLSGPKKFVLLLAHLAKGEAGTEVQLKDIEKRWNKMTVLMGKFNGFYPNRAKEQGWVSTKKFGVYFLRPQWRDIFSD